MIVDYGVCEKMNWNFPEAQIDSFQKKYVVYSSQIGKVLSVWM